ncbi:glycosyl transferase [Sphingobium sp. Ant17]|nr:glycosyl transferase [Sphingobium sp. Ant17]|tara:strand:- start:9035 stop:10675 length:1641 start_codon:yes stop_codon:yes gene_type:complete
MRRKRTEDHIDRIVATWLAARVHVDAFLFDPQAYLTAAKWWLKRKRVRARGQFAPLLSQSPRAYRLWALRQEQTNSGNGRSHIGSAIISLVYGTGDRRQLAITRRSLATEGIPALIIGAAQAHDITAATKSVDWSAKPWLMPINIGDRIAPGTAAAYCAAIAEQSNDAGMAKIIYADDDQLDKRSRRTAPHFKPDWNSELFQHFDYLTGACILHAGRADLEAVADRPDWAQQLVMRAAQAEGRSPVHVRQMLHHRRTRFAPRIPAAPVAPSRDMPHVTIIVPTRNRVDLLRTCLEGIAATDYPTVDVIVVDNDSDDPETRAYLADLDSVHTQVLNHRGVFNYSAINNRAAAQARGQLLCLLNNDIEMTRPDWLAIMAHQAMRHDVGAVGARLLYPDGRIQHAGVVIGVGNAAGHAHRFLHPNEEGYFRRHALPQFTSAVTAACLLVQRERFMAVGGLDERNFAVAFNDVDLCLRLNQRGWQSLYEPRATLIHHESVSRGLDQDPVGAARFAGELAALKRIWNTDEITDPFHHPQLSRAAERFVVAI